MLKTSRKKATILTACLLGALFAGGLKPMELNAAGSAPTLKFPETYKGNGWTTVEGFEIGISGGSVPYLLGDIEYEYRTKDYGSWESISSSNTEDGNVIFSITEDTKGTTYYIRGYDSENEESKTPVVSFNLKKDSENPDIDAYLNDDLTIEASGQDEISGIAGYGLSKDRNTQPTSWSNSEILKYTEPGEYFVWAKDNAGHVSCTRSSITATVPIEKCKISLSGTSFSYTGKEIKPAVTVTYNGKKLIKDEDYTLSYVNNVEATNEAVVTIEGKGHFTDSVEKKYTIKQVETKITTKKDAYKTEVGKTITIPVSVKKGDAEVSYQLSDKKKASFSASTKKLKAKQPGKVTLTVTIDNSKSGCYKTTKKKITITIKPEKLKTANVKAKSKSSLTVYFQPKGKTKISGFAIQYSTDKNFKNNKKTVYMKANSQRMMQQKTITKLKKNKTYYFRMASYYQNEDEKILSSWTKTYKQKTLKK